MMRGANMMRVERERVGEGWVWRRGAVRPREVVVCVVLAGLFVGVRVWRLDASCLWFDEVFSVHAARHGWGALVEFVALDLIHPPLFYLLLKGWIALVGSEAVWWVRLFGVLTAGAACVPVMLLCRELGLRARVGQVAVGLMAVSGFLLQHAREVRMYGMLLLLAACSLWLFARYVQQGAASGGKRQGRLAASLFVVNLLLVYTHYYGWLLVGHELIFVLVWRRRKVSEFALMSGALVVCYSPWLWMVWRAAGAGQGLVAQNIGWAVAPRVWEIAQTFLILHEPFRFRQNTHERAVLRVNVWLALVLFAPAFVALGWRVVGRGRRAAARTLEAGRMSEAGDGVGGVAGERFAFGFLLFFSTAPVVVAFLLSRVLPHSVWGVRHLIIIAPAYLLLAAYALCALRPLWLATTIRLLLACWLALAAVLWFARQRSDAPPVWCAWETLAQRVVEREAAAAGARELQVGSEVKVYATEDLVAYHLWYALSSAGSVGERRFRVARIANLSGLLEDKAFFLPRGFDEVLRTDAGATGSEGTLGSEGLREEHFWAAFRDTSWNAGHPLLRLLAERGYEIEERFEVTASGQKAFIISARRRE
ncbi:MAG: mannosyltransferase [Pyrinomonadaceae bacterium]|nr:mannosyltransferase [Pyrinomonadaceae bacterium]